MALKTLTSKADPMIAKIDPACVRCKFFREIPQSESSIAKGDFGECRRLPPVIIEHIGKDEELTEWNHPGRWQFPAVSYEMWCGEFKERSLPERSP